MMFLQDAIAIPDRTDAHVTRKAKWKHIITQSIKSLIGPLGITFLTKWYSQNVVSSKKGIKAMVYSTTVLIYRTWTDLVRRQATTIYGTFPIKRPAVKQYIRHFQCLFWVVVKFLFWRNFKKVWFYSAAFTLCNCSWNANLIVLLHTLR